MSPKTPLIRVIDDDLDLLNSVEFLLKCEGYEVAAYTDAEEFLRALQAAQDVWYLMSKCRS